MPGPPETVRSSCRQLSFDEVFLKSFSLPRFPWFSNAKILRHLWPVKSYLVSSKRPQFTYTVARPKIRLSTSRYDLNLVLVRGITTCAGPLWTPTTPPPTFALGVVVADFGDKMAANASQHHVHSDAVSGWKNAQNDRTLSLHLHGWTKTHVRPKCCKFRPSLESCKKVELKNHLAA